MEKELPKRKRNRLEHFDYSTAGAYFITICTHNRKNLLSKIVGGDVLDATKNVHLLQYGEIADKYINKLNDVYDKIKVDSYVIMPNHIHILLLVYEDELPQNGASRTSPPTVKQHSTVSRFVSTFKRFCNKECGTKIWQRSFHDHVIRDREDYEKIASYIYENPIKWQFDCFYNE